MVIVRKFGASLYKNVLCRQPDTPLKKRGPPTRVISAAGLRHDLPCLHHTYIRQCRQELQHCNTGRLTQLL